MKRRKKKRRRSNSGERGPGKSGQAGRREHSKSVGGQKIVTMPQAGAKAAKSDGIKKKLPIRAFRREILKTVAKNESFNLAAAGSIIMYDRHAKQLRSSDTSDTSKS